MLRNKLIAAVAATFMATGAFAAQSVKAVDVTADITAISNAQAAVYWANLAADLKLAIVSRIPDRISDSGATITVDISEIELSNSFQELTGASQSKLSGDITIENRTASSGPGKYEMSVTVEQAGGFFPAGTDLATLTMDSPAYYQALIAAYADGVVRRLDDPM